MKNEQFFLFFPLKSFLLSHQPVIVIKTFRFCVEKLGFSTPKLWWVVPKSSILASLHRIIFRRTKMKLKLDIREQNFFFLSSHSHPLLKVITSMVLGHKGSWKKSATKKSKEEANFRSSSSYFIIRTLENFDLKCNSLHKQKLVIYSESKVMPINVHACSIFIWHIPF